MRTFVVLGRTLSSVSQRDAMFELGGDETVKVRDCCLLSWGD